MPGHVAAAPHIPPEQLIGEINAVRAFHGIPPLTLDTHLAASCQAHVDYLLQNGGLGSPNVPDAHSENPGNPGYSDLGNEAAGDSVLGYSLLNGGRPFQNYTVHLWHFLNPLTIRGGAAERTADSNGSPLTQSCQRGAQTDAAGNRRTPSDPPRLWVTTQDGLRSVRPYLKSAEGAQDVGLTPWGVEYISGQHVLLWHDDVLGRPLSNACDTALLGPGGQPVTAPAFGMMIVPAKPLLTGGTYTAVSTQSTGRPCSDLQRTGSAQLTVEPRLTDAQLVAFGEPFAKNGKVVATSEAADTLKLVRGSLRGTYKPGGYTFDLDGSWEYRSEWELSGMQPGETFEARYTSQRIDLGDSCYGPVEVTGSWTRGMDGTTYTRNAPTVKHLADPECDAKPVLASLSVSTGAPGTVVRITGTALTKAIAVSFGGVPATAWSPDGTALLVTVPTGAASGALKVTTSTGEAIATPSFAVTTADSVAPDTQLQLGPSGSLASSTASFAFAATETGSVFACSIDGGAFDPCVSPLRLEGLAVGAHSISIRATDGKGNADASPATRSWTQTGSTPPPGPGVSTEPVAPGGAGPGAGPGRDPVKPNLATTRPPILRAATAVLRRRTGQLGLGTLTLGAAARVRIEGTVTVGRSRLSWKAATVTVPAGKAKALKVVLTRGSRLRLAGRRTVKVRVSLRIAPTAKGAKVTRLIRTLTVRVRA